MAGQGVVQSADEPFLVVLRHGEKGSSHDDEFDLVASSNEGLEGGRTRVRVCSAARYARELGCRGRIVLEWRAF